MGGILKQTLGVCVSVGMKAQLKTVACDAQYIRAAMHNICKVHDLFMHNFQVQHC